MKEKNTYTAQSVYKKRRGVLFVVSSPSGAGKTTLCKKLITDSDENTLSLSVSVTTREPRINEVDKKDYHFIKEEEFVRMKNNGELLESAQVFGYFYGTPVAQIENLIEKGQDVLFDIDWQGARQIAQKMPNDVVRIFILPLSGKILQKRLQTRASDTQTIIEKRMQMAAGELSHYHEYEYVIVNDDINIAYTQIQTILEAERLKRKRQKGIEELVIQLMKEVPDFNKAVK